VKSASSPSPAHSEAMLYDLVRALDQVWTAHRLKRAA